MNISPWVQKESQEMNPCSLFRSKTSRFVSCSGEWSGPEWADPGGGGVPAQGHTHGRGRGAAGPTAGGHFPPSRSGTFVTLRLPLNIPSTLHPVSIIHFTSRQTAHTVPHAWRSIAHGCVCSCAVTSAVNPHSECSVVFSFPS